jgi:predicted nucleic acid-binding protein
MIVYTESNFVLQIALRQEEAEAAESILQYAEKGDVTLSIPEFALSEPFSTVSYRTVEWKRIADSLTRQLLTQLSRSQPRHTEVASIQQLLENLAKMEQEDNNLLHSTVQRILKIGDILPLNTNVFQTALDYIARYGLHAQDAIIYASIITDLKSQPIKEEKCFVSANSKDFDDTKAELKLYNCRYIPKFRDALSFIESHTE